jgi:sortase A
MPFRGALGYALFCVGGASVAFSGGRYALGAWHQQQARQAWEASEAQAVVALAQHASVAGVQPDAPILSGTPVARLLIPRIGLDAIVLEGVDADVLNGGPGHLPGSAFPGEMGNAVISAHRDRHFARLGDVAVGDTLMTEAGTHRNRWVVISKRVIDADAPALFRTNTATLTLTTCWPIRYLGSAPDRLIITARPIRQTGSFASAESD